MIPELGHFALILALLLALAQTFYGLAGPARGNVAWMRTARSAAVGQWTFTLLAFLALIWSFVEKDFSVQYVASNANAELPLLFRITATWGGHEGSLLLWAFILACWTMAVTVLPGAMPLPFHTRVLGVLGVVSVGFLLFVLSTSSPFTRLIPIPLDGRDLNPLLQDIALGLHPPGLYIGYVGFSVAFAFACAALIEGRTDVAWARWARPWTLLAWVALTVGITLGSWWAYYELGWGGWWFWDPVENASFMPWLAGAALIHSLAVTEKRGLFKSWTVLLAIMTFSLSLLGTFLVRSGILVSVHAFASDPARGLYILGFLCAVVGGALALYAWRAPVLKSDAAFELGSREAMILVNNALLVATTGLILIGTLYPLFMDALNLGKISVGPPYFNAVFVIPTLPLVMLLAVGMHSAWKRTRFTQVKTPLAVMLAFSLAISLAMTTLVYDTFSVTALIGFTAAIWVLGSALLEPIERWRRGVALTGGVIGMSLAHLGVGLFTLGVTGVQTYHIEKDISLGAGESAMLSGYEFKFMGIKEVRGPNYDAQEGEIVILRDGKTVTTLRPQKRYYRSGGNPMTEAGIRVGPHRDLFVALGEDLGQGKWSMRVQYKPLIRWIWIGAFVMALGGLAAALDRRYRVTAKVAELEPVAGAARGDA